MPTIIKSPEGIEEQILQLEGIVATEVTADAIKTATEATAVSTAETSTKLDATNTKLDEIKNALGGAASVSNTTTVTAAIISTLLLAAKADRTSYYIRNASNKEMYVNFGAAAVVGEGIKLSKNDVLTGDDFDGIMNAIWETGVSGTAEIIEVSIT